MKKNHALLLFLIILLILPASIANSKSKYYQVGNASWYGKKFHGRKTASGEKYNRRKKTAAHRKLPFGTIVKVTNLENGKSVKVRINDRGPFKGNRIIDLSERAFKNIADPDKGVIKVGIKIKKKP